MDEMLEMISLLSQALKQIKAKKLSSPLAQILQSIKIQTLMLLVTAKLQNLYIDESTNNELYGFKYPII
jgi:hypothetical protein